MVEEHLIEESLTEKHGKQTWKYYKTTILGKVLIFSSGKFMRQDKRGKRTTFSLIDISPDTVVIRTSTLQTIIEGCTKGLYTDITTVETIYSYNSIDSVVTTIDSTVIGSKGWMGDGECDSKDNDGEELDGDLIKNYNLDFNCIEYIYEEGDCYDPSEVNSHQRKKTKSMGMFQLKKQVNKIDLSNIIEK